MRFWQESLLPVPSCVHWEACHCHLSSHLSNGGPSHGSKVRTTYPDSRIIYLLKLLLLLSLLNSVKGIPAVFLGSAQTESSRALSGIMK